MRTCRSSPAAALAVAANQRRRRDQRRHSARSASGSTAAISPAAMQAAGAPVDIFAVGTKVRPARTPRTWTRRTSSSTTAGGRLGSRRPARSPCREPSRCTASPGCTDVLSLRDENAPAGTEPLLETVMCDGARRSRQPTSRIPVRRHAQKPVAPRRPVDGPSAVHRRHRGRGRPGTSGLLRTGSGPRAQDCDEQTGQDEGNVTERARPALRRILAESDVRPRESSPRDRSPVGHGRRGTSRYRPTPPDILRRVCPAQAGCGSTRQHGRTRLTAFS